VYDEKSDVLSIFNNNLKPSESVEFSENIILDINKEGCIVGLQILDASEFFQGLNEKISKPFLSDLENVELEDKEFRNNWFIILSMKSKGLGIIQQPMPLLRKKEYKSPLLCENQ
jgi:uncharacterized protein YuzE